MFFPFILPSLTLLLLLPNKILKIARSSNLTIGGILVTLPFKSFCLASYIKYVVPFNLPIWMSKTTSIIYYKIS